MIEPRGDRRNLKVGEYYKQHIPVQQYDWRDDELQAWHAYLIASGKWNDSVQRGWDSMMRCRQVEGGLLNRVIHRSYGQLPVEVLAQMPAAAIAQGVYWRCPRVALLSHRLGGMLKAVCGTGSSKPNTAAMHRMRDELRALAQAPWAQTLHCNGVTLAGDLRIRFHDGVFDIHVGGNTIIATGNCRDAATLALRRFAIGWACLVRMVIASALRHAAGTYGRTLASPLRFALPAAAGRSENAIAVERGSVRLNTMTFLSDNITTNEWSGRLTVAGKILRAARASEAVQAAIRRAIDDVAVDVPLLQTITFELPTREEIMSRLDSKARQFIHARAGATRVPIEDPRTEVYEVWKDDMAVPRHAATFPSLALAVDFEHANRKEVTLRIGGVAEGRRGVHRLEEAAHG